MKFIFDQLNITHPTFIDIGAHHPFYLSNTALFYETGSHGINIEPDPMLVGEFLKYRDRDINLNIGIGTEAGNADFFVISSPTLNTFSKQVAENYVNEGDYRIIKTINIPINSLNNILDAHNNGKFSQLLSIDAEGVDELIIKSIDYSQNYPLVICIETLSFSDSGNGKKNTSIINFLINNGYLVYADTYINTIFVRKNLLQKTL